MSRVNNLLVVIGKNAKTGSWTCNLSVLIAMLYHCHVAVFSWTAAARQNQQLDTATFTAGTWVLQWWETTSRSTFTAMFTDFISHQLPVNSLISCVIWFEIRKLNLVHLTVGYKCTVRLCRGACWLHLTEQSAHVEKYWITRMRFFYSVDAKASRK